MEVLAGLRAKQGLHSEAVVAGPLAEQDSAATRPNSSTDEGGTPQRLCVMSHRRFHAQAARKKAAAVCQYSHRNSYSLVSDAFLSPLSS